MVKSPLQKETSMQVTETPTFDRQMNHRGTRADHKPPDGNEDESDDGFFETAAKNLIGPCVGVVNIASLFIQKTCRGKPVEEGNAREEGHNPLFFKARLKRYSQMSRRRQGETLEFPADDGFDDDVSAISAHTLEEMERQERRAKLSEGIKMAATADVASSKEGRKPSPGNVLPSSLRKQEPGLSYRSNSNTSMSLGVSTSGSASSEEGDLPSLSLRNKSSKYPIVFQRAQV